MSPRMGVITTAIALTLSVALGVVVTSTNTTANIGMENFTGGFTTTESFTEVVSDSDATCSLGDNTVSITVTDGSASEIGSIDGSATLTDCETTVNGNATATGTLS